MLRLFSILALFAFAVPGHACGPDTDCLLGDRHYRIAMPDGHDGASPVGAIIFAHGYRGSARGTMRNRNMRKMISDMGLAFIAVKSKGWDWDIPGTPSDVDSTGAAELTYFDAVVADVTTRFAIDPDRIMMSGFSAGGMMTWELACRRPDLFAGFVPVAGTFWQGPPKDGCDVPASVIHIHGTTDRTVPLQGRPIGPSSQGNVFDVLKMYRARGAFSAMETVTALETLSCERQSNADRRILEFCTHPGGHSFKRSFLAYGWDRLKAAGHL